MKLDVIRPGQAAACAAIGVLGALIFLFGFPKGSISTLMHAVLGLPGPGAGIALILGPFLILVVLIPSLLSRGAGGALIASLMFAVACALVVRVLGISTNPKGAFGSVVFVAAVGQLGFVAEVVMGLGRGLRKLRRCMLAGALANAGLLVFYWIVVFPRTAGWVSWKDLPLLMGLCLASGLVSGCVACVVSRPLSRVLPLMEGAKE